MLISSKQLEAKIRQAKASKKRKSIGCGDRVILDVTPSGACTFYVRLVTSERKQLKTKLGTYPDLKLAEARKMAREATVHLKEQEEKRKAEAENPCPKFGEFIDQWLETKKDGKDNKRFMTLRALRRHLCAIDDMRLNEIKPADMCRALDNDNLTAGAKHRAVKCFNQAMTNALNRGLIEFNPCSTLTNSAEGVFKKPPIIGFKSVEPERLTELFSRLSNIKPEFKLIMLYITLSCARLGEALNLQWSWIDFDARVITVPAEFMKMGELHRIPLTPQIEWVIKAYKALHSRQSPYVFYAQRDASKKLSPSAVQNRVLPLCNDISSIHGLRKTARSWFAMNNVPFEVAEFSLAHVEKSTVVRAYQKYDFLEERKPVLERWDRFVMDNMPAAFMESLNVNGGNNA